MSLVRKPAASVVSDAHALAQLRVSEAAVRMRLNTRNKKRVRDAPTLSEDWSSLTQWKASAGVSVGGGRMWGGFGVSYPLNLGPNERLTVAWSVKIVSNASTFAYAGPSNSLPADAAPASASDQNGVYAGFSNLNANFAIGTNTTAPGTGNANVPAGEYFLTCVIDETHISYSIMNSTGAGGAMTHRILRSSLPNSTDGTIHKFVMIAAGPAASQAGYNIGPVTMIRETAIPPVTTINGINLFSNTGKRHMIFNRRDEATGIRHVIRVPATYDVQTPAPVVLYLHPAEQGDAGDIMTDANVVPIADMLVDNGYIVAASDNGPVVGPSIEQNDKFGNQAGMDDYIALIRWVQDHFVTDKIYLLGVSMGALFGLNLLAHRQLGNIAALATITPAGDIGEFDSDPYWGARVMAAYGATTSQEYDAAMANYNPAQQPGYKFRGTPVRIYAGTTDTIAPPNIHVYPIVDKLSRYTTVELVEQAVGHVAPSTFNPTEILAFFDAH